MKADVHGSHLLNFCHPDPQRRARLYAAALGRDLSDREVYELTGSYPTRGRFNHRNTTGAQQMNIARSEDTPVYFQHDPLTPEVIRAKEDQVIAEALAILERRVPLITDVISEPKTVRDMLKLKLAMRESECFGALFLNAKLGVIADEILFTGTVSQVSVYPREVIKRALANNASAVVLYHNHPSGSLEPSRADCKLTSDLKSALDLVDVRVIDHIIVAATGTRSFAEAGLL